MSSYTLSPFAKMVIKERGISEETLKMALFSPEEILVSKKDLSLSLHKKIYFHQESGEKRLLLIFVKERVHEFFVLALADTSHIEKYFL